MADGSDADDEPSLDLFQEPEGYYPPPKQPTFVQHRMLDGKELQLRLVGHNPLWVSTFCCFHTLCHAWAHEQVDRPHNLAANPLSILPLTSSQGHHLWQAGRIISNYLEQHATELHIHHASVLELGAGAGLPSLICAFHGASRVLVTDYPDADLIENLRHNITHCCQQQQPLPVQAQGYLWGAPAGTLLADADAPAGFDLLILADLLFNHSEHAKLLTTVRDTLKRAPHSRALVFFTPYRPWLLDKDLAFFELACGADLVVEKILETVMEKVMFEEDPGVSSASLQYLR